MTVIRPRETQWAEGVPCVLTSTETGARRGKGGSTIHKPKETQKRESVKTKLTRESRERRYLVEGKNTVLREREREQRETASRHRERWTRVRLRCTPSFSDPQLLITEPPLCIHRLTSNLAAVTSSLQRAASTYLRTLPACIVPRAARYRLILPKDRSKTEDHGKQQVRSAQNRGGRQGNCHHKGHLFLRAWYDMSGPWAAGQLLAEESVVCAACSNQSAGTVPCCVHPLASPT